MLLCRQQAERTEHAKRFLCKSILQGGRGETMNNPFLCDLQDKIQPRTLRALRYPAPSEPVLLQPEAVDEPWACRTGWSFLTTGRKRGGGGSQGPRAERRLPHTPCSDARASSGISWADGPSLIARRHTSAAEQ